MQGIWGIIESAVTEALALLLVTVIAVCWKRLQTGFKFGKSLLDETKEFVTSEKIQTSSTTGQVSSINVRKSLEGELGISKDHKKLLNSNFKTDMNIEGYSAFASAKEGGVEVRTDGVHIKAG